MTADTILDQLTLIIGVIFALVAFYTLTFGARYLRVNIRRGIGYIKQVFQFRPPTASYDLRPVRHSRDTHRGGIGGRAHQYPSKHPRLPRKRG